MVVITSLNNLTLYYLIPENIEIDLQNKNYQTK